MEEKKEIPGWLHLVPRPGFYVKNGKIKYVNQAAAALMILPGTEICDLIAVGLEEYEAISTGCLCLTLTIGGKPRGASVTPMEGGHLFLLEQESDTEEFRALALASMELRMPLNNVLTLAEQLLADADEKSRAKTASLNRSLYQILRILGNMSDTGQITSGFRPEMQNISACLAEVFEKAQILVAHTGIQLTYQGLAETVLGLVDVDQLERAVFNILSNAVKFTPKGGIIHATLVRSGKRLRLTVTDNGGGIPEDAADTLFYRYLRQPGIEDSRYGLGLGMTLIRSVAANHGGTVLIDKCGGTRVTMTIAIRQSMDTTLRSPWKRPDYVGERDHALVELSDCLPAELYDGTK